jgi:RNA polymerase sigma-70 factor (sigma-E family)
MRDDEFELFVRDNRTALLRFATTLTAGDPHLAEDLVQNALVRVYLAKPSRIGNLQGYVRRAVVNGLIDHRRRPHSRRERPTCELPERATTAPDGVDPQLVAALAALPVRMRAAVVLRHVEGLSVDEAARALSCSTGTIKSQTARGLDKLRDLLAAGDPPTAPADVTVSRLVASLDHCTTPNTDPHSASNREGEHSWPIS